MTSLYLNKKTRLTDLYGKPCENETTFEINADNSYLYATFTCFFKEKPKDMTAIHGKKVYRDECVELFIGSKKEYYEIDVSAYNVRFIALVENPNGDPEPEASETEINGLETSIEWLDSCYIARYKLPIVSVKEFGKEIYFNAFRVEMVEGKRVSRTISKTNCTSHHVPQAFISINL
jgi:hypothetical protein